MAGERASAPVRTEGSHGSVVRRWPASGLRAII